MKGIVTCDDCQFYIAIYRFIGSQGFFKIPKKWCDECDLLVALVKKTINELGIETKPQLTIKALVFVEQAEGPGFHHYVSA